MSGLKNISGSPRAAVRQRRDWQKLAADMAALLGFGLTLTGGGLIAVDDTVIVPYTGATANVDLGTFDLTTTGLGTFGNLDVDTLNLNGNTITDSTGTISFDDENLTTSGILRVDKIYTKPTGDPAFTSQMWVYTNGSVCRMYLEEDAGTHDVEMHWRRGGQDWIMVVNSTGWNLQVESNLLLTVDRTTGVFDFKANDLTTTGLGTFGNLDVDTLNLNANVISDSTGTISFGDENLTTIGLITAANLTLTNNSSVISSAYPIDIKPNGDTDDYFQITTIGNSVLLGAVGGDLNLAAESSIVNLVGVTTTLGDGGTTDYVSVSAIGDLVFHGAGGLVYGEISGYNENDTITITAAGIANKVQVTTFDTAGPSNNTTPSAATDDITITNAGYYLCSVSISIESSGGGGADEIGIGVHKNNGATLFENCHSHRKLAGGGGDTGSISISGIIDLAVNDTIELWIWNEDSTDDVIVDDVTLTLIQIGGT